VDAETGGFFVWAFRVQGSRFKGSGFKDSELRSSKAFVILNAEP
jgi:hypothetical protein